LLGHVITNDGISKNNTAEKEKNKSPPLDYNNCFNENNMITYDDW